MKNLKNLRNQSCFKISFGKYSFEPGLLSTLITLTLFIIFVYLGFWQFSRYEWKNGKIYEHQQKSKLPALTIKDLETIEVEKLQFRILTIEGEFLKNRDILLDNQIFKGVAGYVVLSPFQIKTPNPRIILVNRGWIPWGENRNTLPVPTHIPGEISISGILDFPKPAGLKLKNNFKNSSKNNGTVETETPGSPPSQTFPLRLQAQEFDFETLSIALGKGPIFPMLLNITEPGVPNSTEREATHFTEHQPTNFTESQATNFTEPKDFNSMELQTPNVGLSPLRHLGYALQWFTMALAVLIYYTFINIRTNIRKD